MVRSLTSLERSDLGNAYVQRVPRITAYLFLACSSFLTACSGPIRIDQNPPPTTEEKRAQEEGKLFGENGLLSVFGGNEEQATGIGVNEFLWQASLDILGFMPLSQVDPFGGVILTDWHSPPTSQNVRFRLNVFLKGRALRSDGLSITVFRQRKSGESWIDTEVEQKTKINLENTILTRARELRAAAIQAQS